MYSGSEEVDLALSLEDVCHPDPVMLRDTCVDQRELREK